MNFSRCKAIFQKESKHVMRDPFVLILALLLPFLIVIILGNAIEFNLANIPIIIVDQNKSKESLQLINTFSSSGYFKTYFRESPAEAMAEIHQEKAKVALIIPPDFANKITSPQADGGPLRSETFPPNSTMSGTYAPAFERRRLDSAPLVRHEYLRNKIPDTDSPEVQILVDGADNMSLNAALGYIASMEMITTAQILNAPVQKKILQTRLLFNPELNSKWFIIPGLSAVIIALVSILLTSLAICREQEQGSMEMLLSTPVKAVEIVIGKILPYAFLSWSGFGIVYAAARLIYDVPFYGSHWILLLGTAIFILDYLALGLFISIIAKQQQLAVQMAMVIGLLPTILLSGFVFPLEYMPDILQYITVIFPARWYIAIARCEFLKASSFADLAIPFVALIIQGAVLVTAAIKKFKDTLE
ncbi:MAG: ABC transporter permease [Holosporaceae bacterium]|jgi:ABC-2 type transport system permease protein|nr:ABC transporter permease [Holosporaceae bacterium]